MAYRTPQNFDQRCSLFSNELTTIDLRKMPKTDLKYLFDIVQWKNMHSEPFVDDYQYQSIKQRFATFGKNRSYQEYTTYDNLHSITWD